MPGMTLTEADSFDADIIVPTNGDDVDAPTIMIGAFQKLPIAPRNLFNRMRDSSPATARAQFTRPLPTQSKSLVTNGAALFRSGASHNWLGYSSDLTDNGTTVTAIAGDSLTVQCPTTVYGAFSLGDSTTTPAAANV